MTAISSIFWVFFTATFALILLRWRPPETLNIFANIFCLYLIGYTTYSLITNEDLRHKGSNEHIPATYQKAITEFNDLSFNKKSTPTTSIFHIVLDGYSGAQSLMENYQYDNSTFINRLESMGFLILENTHTPYNQTLPSLGSMFLGRYWKANGDDFSGKNAKANRRYWGKITTQGPLHSKLKQAGYTLLYTDSGYPYLEPASDATFLKPRTRRDMVSDFTYYYTLRTIIGPWLESRLASDSIERHKNLIVNAFSHTAYLDSKKPFYLYQHILSPHPPFIFDDEGNTTKEFSAFLTTKDGSHSTGLIPANIKKYKKGYINKLKVTNELLLAQLDKLFQVAPKNLIVIIQGDHGGGAYLDQNSSVNTCLSDRFSPFFAVFSTDESIRKAFGEYKKSPYNIVNTYRIILSEISDSHLPPLEDHSWFVPWKNLNGIHPVELPQGYHCVQEEK